MNKLHDTIKYKYAISVHMDRLSCKVFKVSVISVSLCEDTSIMLNTETGIIV